VSSELKKQYRPLCSLFTLHSLRLCGGFLRQVVEEAVELYRKDGKPLPPATSGRDFPNKLQQVA